MQNQNEVSRIKIVISTLFSLGVLGGGWFYVSRDAYLTYIDVVSKAEIVDINVYGLWMPLGASGVLITVIAAFSVAFVTKKKAHKVWGDKGQSFLNWLIGISGVIGLVFAFTSYHWMTSELKQDGYSYCKELSRFKAMGRHEVYVKDLSLCKK